MRVRYQQLHILPTGISKHQDQYQIIQCLFQTYYQQLSSKFIWLKLFFISLFDGGYVISKLKCLFSHQFQVQNISVPCNYLCLFNQYLSNQISMNAADFFCGLVAGWSQIVIGQPFDFIKVRIQTAIKSPPTIPQIVKDIYSEYGLRGFYRGSSSLFFGFAFTIGTQFLIYEWAKRQIFKNWGKRNNDYNPANLKIWQIGLAGGIVGAIASFIYCPVQYVKIQKQVSRKIQTSAIGLLFKQFINHGSRNIYKGFLATIIRQTFGSILYYGSYEAVVRAYTKQNRDSATDLMFLSAGAIAGLTYHFFTYPIDTIKTNIQAGKDWRQAVSMSLQWSKLKGYKVVLTRAVIVNACSFMIYEKAQKQVKRFNDYLYSVY